jgi:outer membrane receptor protein involved in Fe transport
MSMNRLLAGALAAALLAGVGAAPGAARAEAGSAPNGAEPSGGEVVVTAQKREERLKDVPVPVSTRTGQLLTEQGDYRIQNLQTELPGLSITPGGGVSTWQNIAIRGITTASGNHPRVAVTLDDVPLGATTYLGGGLFFPDFDPSELSRIEVLRGPQGTLYGASSLGGLIKYVTNNPSTERFGGSVEAGANGVEHGPNLGASVRGSVNAPVNDKLAVLVSGFVNDLPGWIDDKLTGVKGVNEYRSSGVHASALWRPDDRVSVKLGGLHEFDRGALDDVASIDNGAFEQPYPPETSDFTRRTDVLTLNSNIETKLATFTYIAGLNKIYLTNNDNCTGNLGFLTQAEFGSGICAERDKTWNRKFTQELRAEFHTGSHLDWLIGGFYAHEHGHWVLDYLALDPSSYATIGDSIHFNFPTTTDEWAIFGDLTIRFNDRFDVQVGGRKSRISQTGNENIIGAYYLPVFAGRSNPVSTPAGKTVDHPTTYLFTPRYKFSENAMVYVRLASGYSPGGFTVLLNSPLLPTYKPEQTYNYEVGLKAQMFRGMLSLDASLYYIYWKDIQMSATDPKSKLYYTINGSNAISKGLEASAELRPAERTTISAWIDIAEAKLNKDLPPGGNFGLKGDRLPFSAPVSGYLSVEQRFDLPYQAIGFVRAAGTYTGNRLGIFEATPARLKLPSYETFDLYAGVTKGPWRVTAYLTNVTNELGVVSKSNSPNLATFYVRPRSFGLNVRREF